MGVQFWWFYDVVVVAAILISLFITVKKGLLKATFSLLGYIIAISVAISLSSTIAGSFYKSAVRESNIKKIDQSLSQGDFTDDLANYLESQGYNIYIDRDRFEQIYIKGEKVDENIYKYVNNINGKKVDEEAIFYNKLHEGYATVTSNFVSKQLSVYSAECAAEEIRKSPEKFYGFMKLMEEEESRRGPATFLVDNYLEKPYKTQLRLIIMLALLVVLILLSLFISSSAGRNDKTEPGLITHFMCALAGIMKGAVIVFAIAVMVRLYVVMGSNRMLFFNHEAIERTYIFKYIYELVTKM